MCMSKGLKDGDSEPVARGSLDSGGAPAGERMHTKARRNHRSHGAVLEAASEKVMRTYPDLVLTLSKY